jgi:hypothetical protein
MFGETGAFIGQSENVLLLKAVSIVTLNTITHNLPMKVFIFSQRPT